MGNCKGGLFRRGNCVLSESCVTTETYMKGKRIIDRAPFRARFRGARVESSFQGGVVCRKFPAARAAACKRNRCPLPRQPCHAQNFERSLGYSFRWRMRAVGGRAVICYLLIITLRRDWNARRDPRRGSDDDNRCSVTPCSDFFAPREIPLPEMSRSLVLEWTVARRDPRNEDEHFTRAICERSANIRHRICLRLDDRYSPRRTYPFYWNVRDQYYTRNEIWIKLSKNRNELCLMYFGFLKKVSLRCYAIRM